MSALEIGIRPARPDDFPAVTALLSVCQLPTNDLTHDILSTFFVAESGKQIVGACGFEVSGTDGLLRSLAVAPDARGNRLGERLVARCEAAAQSGGVKNLYLLTTTADAYLRRLGYVDVLRESAPPAVSTHPQFRGLCPASAKCLKKLL